MAQPLILSNRLQRLQQAGLDFGDTVAANRQLQLENQRRAAIDEQNAKAASQQLEIGGVSLAEARRLAEKNKQIDAFGQQINQLQDQTQDPATLELMDRLRAKMFTTGGTPTAAGDLSTAREDKQFQSQTLRSAEKRAQGTYESNLKTAEANREMGKFQPITLEGNTLGAFNSRTGQTQSLGVGVQPKGSAAGKPPTADQSKAAMFGKRVEQAIGEMGRIAKNGYDRSSIAAGIGSHFPNVLRSSDAQQQAQAERNFVNAVLRRESGAAISPSEFASAEEQYFPKSGDSEEVLKQKERNRLQVLEGLRAESGNAWDTMKSVGSGDGKTNPDNDPLGLGF